MYKQEVGQYPGKFKSDTIMCDSTPLETLDCTFCEFYTDLKVNLNEHVRVFHQAKEVNQELENMLGCFRCRNCDFGTHSLLVLTKHLYKSCNKVFDNSQKQSDKGKPQITRHWLKCDQCAYKTKYKRVLKRHTSFKHPYANPQEVWFNCNQCSYKTVLKKSLELHSKNKHPQIEPQNVILIKFENCLYAAKPNSDDNPQNELWFNCELCPYKTMLERSLERHIKHKHSDIQPSQDAVFFKCDHCTYETRNKCNFQRHNVFRHSNIEPGAKKFKCEYCPYRAKARNNLDRHLLSKHPDLVPCSWLECKHCSYKNPIKDNLKLHMKAKHFQLEPQAVVWYKCKECSYQTTVKYNLKSHVDRRHPDDNAQGVLWFTCEHCSYKSKFVTDLKRHQSTVHPDLVVRNWLACEQCSFKSTLKRDLKAHIRTNHGVNKSGKKRKM